MAVEAELSQPENLAIVAHCQALVWRAAALIDGNHPEGLVDVFAEGAVLLRPGGTPLQGAAEIVRAYSARPAGRVTRHLVTNTLVEVESRSLARSRSYVLLWSGSDAGDAGQASRPAEGVQKVGEFDDTFALGPAGWRIARREARFIFHSSAN